MYLSVSTNQPSPFTKKSIGLMRITIVVGNHGLSVIWTILKILNISLRTLYLMLSPLMLVKKNLIMKVMNMLWNEVTSQIKIITLQCMLIFHHTRYKILMLVRSRTILWMEKTLFMVQKQYWWNTFNMFENKRLHFMQGWQVWQRSNKINK